MCNLVLYSLFSDKVIKVLFHDRFSQGADNLVGDGFLEYMFSKNHLTGFHMIHVFALAMPDLRWNLQRKQFTISGRLIYF